MNGRGPDGRGHRPDLARSTVDPEVPVLPAHLIVGDGHVCHVGRPLLAAPPHPNAICSKVNDVADLEVVDRHIGGVAR